MKPMAVLIAVALLLALLTVSVGALSPQELYEQQLEASGAGELYDVLPEETQALLRRIGVDEFSMAAALEMTPQTVLSTLRDLVREESTAPFTSATVLLGVLLCLGFFEALQPAGGDSSGVFRCVCVLAAITPLLVPLWQTMQRTLAAAESASVFLLSFAPVYAAMLLASGGTATALTFQTLMLTTAEGIGVLAVQVIVPLCFVSLAFGVAGAMDPAHRLTGIGSMVSKINTWMLTVSLMIFVALLSFQSILAAGADTVGGRMLRFSVAGFVPIVGGSLSEALYTVQGCLSALRGTVGGFGVLCAVCIVLPTLLECVVWDVLLFLVKITAELFSFQSIAAVAGMLKGVMKTLIAVLSSAGLLLVISLTLVTMGVGVR